MSTNATAHFLLHRSRHPPATLHPNFRLNSVASHFREDISKQCQTTVTILSLPTPLSPCIFARRSNIRIIQKLNGYLNVHVFRFVTASQPINGIAFVLDGLYYGVSDFGYAAYSMLLVGFTSSFLLIALGPSFGLSGVWAGLFIFMVLRVVAGFWRLGSKEGPWKRIWSEVDVNTTGE